MIVPGKYAIPGALALMLAVSVTYGSVSTSRARQRAQMEAGRAEVLQAARETAEASLASSEENLAAWKDSVDLAWRQAEVATAKAKHEARRASEAAKDAEGRVRAALDSAGLSVAPLDSLVAAHAQEMAAKDAEIGALERERAILYRRIEATDTALVRSEAVNAALRLELQSWQKQAADWKRAASPPLLAKVGKFAGSFALGYLAGRLAP